MVTAKKKSPKKAKKAKKKKKSKYHNIKTDYFPEISKLSN